MAQEMRQPVESVVIGFADPVFDERRHARAAAKHLNVHLHEHELPVDALDTLPEIIWHYGQPFADPSMVPTYYVAKYARQHVTVVLNGDGGDELFGGYSRPVVARAAAPYKKFVPAAIRRSVGDWFSGTQNRILRKASLLARAGQYDGYRSFLYERGFQEYRDLMYTDAFRAETSSSRSERILPRGLGAGGRIATTWIACCAWTSKPIFPTNCSPRWMSPPWRTAWKRGRRCCRKS